MAYEVLARKWRPKQFDEVVGQSHVTRTLVNALTTNRVAQAYLLVGPRGVGKTTTARILAKALNCEHGPTPTPCDACDSCKEVAAGNSLDVLEFDAASNTQVDKIREIIIEPARYAPARDRCKIYIVDEVHMLSGSSFNALLKTLEEPPEHVKFVFCTTEPQKVPTTIISRCQRFDLRRLSTRDILDHLAKIAAEEKIDVEPDALLAIARGADGALRDAESALDQLIGFRGTHIGEDDVLAVFGLVARQVLEDLAGAVLGGDLRTAVQLVHEMDGAGKDLQRLTIELLGYFRSLLILAAAGAEAVGEDLAASQLETMTAHLRASTPSQILRIVDVLTEAEGRMRFALSRRTLLEVALIRCAQIATSVSIEGVLAQLDSLKKAVAGAAAPQTAYVAPADTPSSGVRELKAEAPSTPPRAEATGVGGLAELQSAWPKIVEQVGRAAPLAQSSLAGARPLRVDGRQVVVALDPTFCESLDKLDFPRNRKALQKAIGDVLQREVAVELVLEGGDKKEEAAKQSEAPSKESRRRPTKSRQEWIRDPAVKKTLEAFNGDIQDIH